MLVGLPPNVTFEAAATLPTVFITADTAFQHATSLQPGDRVLVHAAAGRVLDTGCSSEMHDVLPATSARPSSACLIFMIVQDK